MLRNWRFGMQDDDGELATPQARLDAQRKEYQRFRALACRRLGLAPRDFDTRARPLALESANGKPLRAYDWIRVAMFAANGDHATVKRAFGI